MRNQPRYFRPPLWWVKLTNYEYWSMGAFYLPLLPYISWQALRARSLTYFTAVNPGIANSGFVGEEKQAILDLIPDAYKPKSLLVSPETELFTLVECYVFHYPLIAKPNVGERGNGVAKIGSPGELAAYHSKATAPYLIQEYVDYPIELGVFYSRLPGQTQGTVSSVTLKEFLHVKGDGHSTLGDLVMANTRARFQAERLRQLYKDRWDQVLEKGEYLELEPIGNHCRGTRFVNANHLIVPELEAVFDKICEQIDGFYYGRFDLRVPSIPDLYAGQQIRIMELNGVSSEPGHIYDASYGLWKAYRSLAWHWKRIADISIAHQKAGIRPMPFSEFWRLLPF